MVKGFLNLGEDPNQVNSENKTALYIAREKGYADVVKHLLDHDADLDASVEFPSTEALERKADPEPSQVIAAAAKAGAKKRKQPPKSKVSSVGAGAPVQEFDPMAPPGSDEPHPRMVF